MRYGTKTDEGDDPETDTRPGPSSLGRGSSSAHRRGTPIRRHHRKCRVYVALLAHWQTHRREVLGKERAAYGQQIVVSVARQLVQEYGPSFGEKNLRRMIQFAEVFPKEEIVVSLIRQLSWTHFIALLPLKNPLATGLLCGTLPRRRLECQHAATEDRLHALRAHGCIAQT